MAHVFAGLTDERRATIEATVQEGGLARLEVAVSFDVGQNVAVLVTDANNQSETLFHLLTPAPPVSH